MRLDEGLYVLEELGRREEGCAAAFPGAGCGWGCVVVVLVREGIVIGNPWNAGASGGGMSPVLLLLLPLPRGGRRNSKLQPSISS